MFSLPQLPCHVHIHTLLTTKIKGVNISTGWVSLGLSFCYCMFFNYMITSQLLLRVPAFTLSELPIDIIRYWLCRPPQSYCSCVYNFFTVYILLFWNLIFPLSSITFSTGSLLYCLIIDAKFCVCWCYLCDSLTELCWHSLSSSSCQYACIREAIHSNMFRKGDDVLFYQRNSRLLFVRKPFTGSWDTLSIFVNFFTIFCSLESLLLWIESWQRFF